MKVDLRPYIEQSYSHRAEVIGIDDLCPSKSFFIRESKKNNKILMTIENRNLVIKVPKDEEFPELIAG